jgi:hypothetical protein
MRKSRRFIVILADAEVAAVYVSCDSRQTQGCDGGRDIYASRQPKAQTDAPVTIRPSSDARHHDPRLA